MLKLKLQYFGHLMRRTDSLGKDPDAGKDSRREEKGMTEDEMFGWHHRLNGCEFEQTLQIVRDRAVWRAALHGVTKSQTTEQQQQSCQDPEYLKTLHLRSRSVLYACIVIGDKEVRGEFKGQHSCFPT